MEIIMPRPKDARRAVKLMDAFHAYELKNGPLPGISSPANRQVLVEQMLESIHRVEYVPRIRHRNISPNRANPASDLFDPLKAAILHFDSGNVDEAFWHVFLFVHFGKNSLTGWRLARDVYGALGSQPWTWARVSANPVAFRTWLAKNQTILRGGDGVARRFGAHRQYQSLNATSPAGTGAAVQSYTQWVGPTNTHSDRFQTALRDASGNACAAFHDLYVSMGSVASFGRLARFDYLTMLGKLEFVPIKPGSTYMSTATGPLQGARLLFGNQTMTAKELDTRLLELDVFADVGMQVLEDSICNWQKSPAKFQAFRG